MRNCYNEFLHSARCVLLYREATEHHVAEHSESASGKEILDLCKSLYSQVINETHQN